MRGVVDSGARSCHEWSCHLAEPERTHASYERRYRGHFAVSGETGDKIKGVNKIYRLKIYNLYQIFIVHTSIHDLGMTIVIN